MASSISRFKSHRSHMRIFGSETETTLDFILGRTKAAHCTGVARLKQRSHANQEVGQFDAGPRRGGNQSKGRCHKILRRWVILHDMKYRKNKLQSSLTAFIWYVCVPDCVRRWNPVLQKSSFLVCSLKTEADNNKYYFFRIPHCFLLLESPVLKSRYIL